MKQVLVRTFVLFFRETQMRSKPGSGLLSLIHYYPLSLNNIVRLEATVQKYITALFQLQRIAPDAPGAGDCGTLTASPFMISCIEASKASTLVDIWFTGIE